MGKKRANTKNQLGKRRTLCKQQKKQKFEKVHNRQHGLSTPDGHAYGTTGQFILIVGDGDFSFSRGLIRSLKSGKRVYATSFDSNQEVQKKYTNATECISECTGKGAKVAHSIDATKLSLLPPDAPPLFQFIIFNFPHTGMQRVHLNRILLQDFFTSARDKLEFSGEVHVTLKTKPPYSNWNLEEQARSSGFVLKERTAFRLRQFPGYYHRTTDPLAKVFEPESCKTFKFVVDRSKFSVPEVIWPKGTKKKNRPSSIVVTSSTPSATTRIQFEKRPQVPKLDTVSIAQRMQLHPLVNDIEKRNNTTLPLSASPWKPLHKPMSM